MGCEKESWICVALDRMQLWTLFIIVIYLWVCAKSDIICVTMKNLSSSVFRTICLPRSLRDVQVVPVTVKCCTTAFMQVMNHGRYCMVKSK